MKVLLLLIQPLIYLWFLGLIIFIALPVVLIALPFGRETRFKITAPMWVFFFKAMIKTIFFAQVLYIDRRDEKSRQVISPPGLYIANHQSFGDIPLIFSTILMPPIAKKQVLYLPILGALAYASGAILVDRSDKDSRKKVFETSKNELLGPRRQLQYYPEGTRRKDGGFGPKPFEEIKTTLLKVAYDYNIPVYPVSMYGTSKMVNSGLITPAQKVGIIFHESVHAHEHSTEEAFARAAWQKVIEGFQELHREINS